MDEHDVELEFTQDPAWFLQRAGPVLAADPVAASVVASVTRRLVTATPPPPGAVPRWWVLALHEGDVVGVAMRTMAVAPYAAYVLDMPAPAARALGRAVHERGEHLPALNGARPAVDLVAAELARLGGGSVRVAERLRLHVLGTLCAPRPVAGSVRRLTAAEADLARDLLDAFVCDADEQGGRSPQGHEQHDLEDVRDRIAQGLLWCWADDSGAPVHLTGVSAPGVEGVARIGPVYTPPEHRGRGYASAAVHAVACGLVADGARVCLFTDEANPTSNHVYADLGFEAVAETASLRVERGHAEAGTRRVCS